MKSKIALLFCSLALATSCFASCPEISGFWSSTSGSSVNICYPGNPDTFVIVVTDRKGNRNEFTAHWMQGFRVQFYYNNATGTVYGVYNPDNGQISIVDGRGQNFTWYR